MKDSCWRRFRRGQNEFSSETRKPQVFGKARAGLSPFAVFAALTLTTENRSLLSSTAPLPAGPASALSLLLSSPSSAQGQCPALPEGIKELARCAVEPRLSCFFVVGSLPLTPTAAGDVSDDEQSIELFLFFKDYYSPSTFRSRTGHPHSVRRLGMPNARPTPGERGKPRGRAYGKATCSLGGGSRSLFLLTFLLVVLSLSRSLEYSLKNQQVPWSLL